MQGLNGIESAEKYATHYSCEDQMLFLLFLRALNSGEDQNSALPLKTFCFESSFHDFIEKFQV